MTDIEICNLALGLLGKAAITALTDATPQGVLCNALYPGVRDAVLEDRAWTFAKQQYKLQPEAAAPLFDYDNKFALPGDVVRVVKVRDFTDDNPLHHGGRDVRWEKYGRFIYADAQQSIFISAVSKVADTSLYSPNFCIALATRMAFKMAVPLTENRQLKADLWAEYQTEIRDASGADGAQGRSEVIRSDHLSRSR